MSNEEDYGSANGSSDEQHLLYSIRMTKEIIVPVGELTSLLLVHTYRISHRSPRSSSLCVSL